MSLMSSSVSIDAPSADASNAALLVASEVPGVALASAMPEQQ